jgi:hypothetical protein
MDKLKLDLDVPTLHENFEELQVVKSDTSVISQDIQNKIDEIIANEEAKQEQAKQASTEKQDAGNAVDDFFDS